jgi:hypothetical protein
MFQISRVYFHLKIFEQLNHFIDTLHEMIIIKVNKKPLKILYLLP